MITALGRLFGWLGEVLQIFFREVLNTVVKFSMTLWGLIIIVASIAWLVLSDTVGALLSIVDLVSGIGSGDISLASPGGSSVLWFLSVANTFTPLDEAFAYGATYLFLVGSFGLYKLLKGWLPEVFGWGFAGSGE